MTTPHRTLVIVTVGVVAATGIMHSARASKMPSGRWFAMVAATGAVLGIMDESVPELAQALCWLIIVTTLLSGDSIVTLTANKLQHPSASLIQPTTGSTGSPVTPGPGPSGANQGGSGGSW